MHLYPFSSDNHDNIERAFNARLWAVRPWTKGPIEASRKTRARQMPVGALGIIYSKQKRSFTMPFIVETRPDSRLEITDVWPGAWVLPFSIRPLGNPRDLVHIEEAKRDWGFLRGCANVSHEMPLSGAAAFASKLIGNDDRDNIIRHLAFRLEKAAVYAPA